MKTFVSRASAILVVLFFTITFGVSVAISQESNIDPSTETDASIALSAEQALQRDARWYADHFNVPFEEALYRLRLQGDIGDLDATLREDERDTFAGLWIQNEPEYRIIAAFTSDGSETIRPYIENQEYAYHVEVRTFPVSLAELESVQEQMYTEIVGLGLNATSGVDVINNRITLEVTDLSQLYASIQNASLQLPEYVEVVETKKLPVLEADDYAGLDQNEGTSGYIVYSIYDPSKKYHTTAAHLTDTIYVYPPGSSAIYLPFHPPQHHGGNYDYQVHTIPSSLTPRPWAKDGIWDPQTPGFFTVSGVKTRTQQSVGSTACHFGKTSGYSCGTIQNNAQCVTVNGQQGCRWVSVTGANHAGGDSGGPWFHASYAYGIHAAGGGDTTIYMPVDNIYDHGWAVWIAQ